jgi:hypothetical protein
LNESLDRSTQRSVQRLRPAWHVTKSEKSNRFGLPAVRPESAFAVACVTMAFATVAGVADGFAAR